MRKYIELIVLNLKSSLAYRAEVYFSLLKTILLLVVQIAIWRSLFGNDVAVQLKTGSIDLKDMINYGIISTFISIVISNGVIQIMGDKVRTGNIVMELIKPLHLMGNILSQVIGSCLFRLLYIVLPLTVIMFIIYGFYFPSPVTFFLYIVSFINAFLIFFLISYAISLTAFYYFEIWHFERLLDDIVKVMSGSLIPLWFFPSKLLKIIDYLPFKYIYFMPINIYLEKIELGESIRALVIQVIWIVLIFLLVEIMWKRVMKRIVVQGG